MRSNFSTPQLGYELFLIGSKSFAWIKELIESADECFIVRAQAPNNGAETRLNLVRIFGAEVIVYKHDQGQRKRLNRKESDLLLDIVFKYAEFILPNIGNKSSAAVFDGDRQNDQRGVQSNYSRCVRLPRSMRVSVSAALEVSALEEARALERAAASGPVSEATAYSAPAQPRWPSRVTNIAQRQESLPCGDI